MVETTHPEVIAAPVVEQPQMIADADVPVAEEVAAQAEPVTETQETAPVVEETPDVVTVAPETVTAEPDVVAAEPVAVEPEVVAEPEVIAEPVAAPVIAEAPTAPAPVSEPVVVAPIAEAAAPVVAESVAEHSHATAPMTRAPARNMCLKRHATVTGSALLSPLMAKAPQVVTLPRTVPLLDRLVLSLSSKNDSVKSRPQGRLFIPLQVGAFPPVPASPFSSIPETYAGEWDNNAPRDRPGVLAKVPALPVRNQLDESSLRDILGHRPA